MNFPGIGRFLNLRMKRHTAMAGLFVSGAGTRFVSLDIKSGGLAVQHAFNISNPSPSLRMDAGTYVALFESSLDKLRDVVGVNVLSKGVVIGIRPEDVLLRVVDFPVMDRKDMADAFKFEFDRYFPFSALEAVFDLAVIDYPVKAPAGQINMLAAAAKLHLIEHLMEVSKNKGIPVLAVEPVHTAAFRSLSANRDATSTDGHLYVVIEDSNLIIMLGYMGNGILFRSVPHQHWGNLGSDDFTALLGKELFSTVNFASSQFRDLNISDVYLGGQGGVYSDVIVPVVENVVNAKISLVDSFAEWKVSHNIAEKNGWDIPLGLALREADKFS